MIKRILLITLCSLFALLANSQSFEAKFIAGFAASQIDGDALAGYNQLGGVTGIATNFPISEKMDFQQEIVYYGRGSRPSADQAFSAPFNKKGLHYVDIDAILNYHFDEKILFQGGLGYGIPFKINGDRGDDLSNYNGDIFWTFGAGYYLTETIIGLGRIQYSILSIDKRDGAFNNSINFGFRFILSGKAE